MHQIRYFIYDSFNIADQQKIDIEEYKYNSTTLIHDFYNELVKKYIIVNKEKIKDYDIFLKNITFRLLDDIFGFEIDYTTKDLFLYEKLRNQKDKIYCIVPVLPIGGTIALYKNYKIIVHSNENNHLRFPHVHVYNQVGASSIISLIDFKITGDLEMKRKEESKILEYIKNNKERLTELYNQIIEHKEIGKVVIDVID